MYYFLSISNKKGHFYYLSLSLVVKQTKNNPNLSDSTPEKVFNDFVSKESNLLKIRG